MSTVPAVVLMWYVARTNSTTRAASDDVGSVRSCKTVLVSHHVACSSVQLDHSMIDLIATCQESPLRRTKSLQSNSWALLPAIVSLATPTTSAPTQQCYDITLASGAPSVDADGFDFAEYTIIIN